MTTFKPLKPINDKPIDIDYNNADEEGAIRLNTRGSVRSIEELGIQLHEGQLVWISDGELDYLGIVIWRRDMWVVVSIEGTRTDAKK